MEQKNQEKHKHFHRLQANIAQESLLLKYNSSFYLTLCEKPDEPKPRQVPLLDRFPIGQGRLYFFSKKAFHQNTPPATSMPRKSSAHSFKCTVSREIYCFTVFRLLCPRICAVVVTGIPATVISFASILRRE